MRIGDKGNELRYKKSWVKLNAEYSIDDNPDMDKDTKEAMKEHEMRTAVYVNRRIDEILRSY